MKENIPFTYLVGWSKLNIWYYGVRWKKECQPSDLWVNYFTSSKYVKTFREDHGEPDVIQIRRTFANKEAAKNWEEIVIRRMNLSKRSDFLNKGNPNSFRGHARFHTHHTPWNKGKTDLWHHTEESKKLISKFNIGKTLSEEHKSLISDKQKGRIRITDGVELRLVYQTDIIPDGWYVGFPQHLKDANSVKLTGKPKPPRTEEHSRKISESNKGKPKRGLSEKRKGGKHIFNPETMERSYLFSGNDLPSGFVYGRGLIRNQNSNQQSSYLDAT